MRLHHGDERTTIWHGDSLEVLRELADCSVDSVVTDPPYGLEFMGREWDSFAPQNTTAQRSNAGGFGDEAGKPWNKARSGTKGVRSTFRCRTCQGWSGTFSEARAKRQKACECEAPDYDYAGAPAQTVAFGKWCNLWATECLRVLKPGGHLLAFGGTRTWHRLACAVEDAGFEVRDSIAWLYGSGFPKSLDVSKAIDKSQGATGTYGEPKSAAHAGWLDRGRMRGEDGNEGWQRPWMQDEQALSNAARKYEAGSPEAQAYAGWGTALKPAFEPIVVARKPLAGTVAANVLQHGTGALNIDGCRIEHGGNIANADGGGQGAGYEAHNKPARIYGKGLGGIVAEPHTAGRWPTNVVLDDSQAEALDEQSGESVSRRSAGRQTAKQGTEAYGDFTGTDNEAGHNDSGGASRFFPTFRYEAKAPTSERPRYKREGEGADFLGDRDKRCTKCGKQRVNVGNSACACPEPDFQPDPKRVGYVAHPTVKPLDLMRWLVRLVTPPGGTVLEPFAGSGTTVEACIVEGFHCIAIEREADYLPLIMQRVNRRRDPVAYIKAAGDDLGLFELDGEGA